MSIGCAGVTPSHEVVYYYGVLEYMAGSQSDGLKGKDQECVVESQNVSLNEKGQECVVVYCFGSGSEKTVCALGSKMEG